MTATESTRLGIIKARKRLNLTQSQLGALLGVSQQAIAKIESPKSNMRVNTVVRIATALGMRVNFNFHRD